MTTRNPFDTDAALAAHARMPAGQTVVLLVDEPDDPAVLEAERQRQRIREWHRRQRIKAAQAENARKAREGQR